MLKILWKIFKILRWHCKTFPEYDGVLQLQKLGEEVLEYEEAMFFKGDDELEKETADVIIAAIGCLRFGYPRELVDEKMEINHTRTFDENGHHVEDANAALSKTGR